MEFTRPEGCQAAVTSDWENHRDGSKLTARLVCGDRNNVCESSFPREFMNINHSYKAEQATADMSKKTTTTLGAMCLGCPYNTVTSMPAEETA